jgi:hypothetical protein
MENQRLSTEPLNQPPFLRIEIETEGSKARQRSSQRERRRSESHGPRPQATNLRHGAGKKKRIVQGMKGSSLNVLPMVRSMRKRSFQVPLVDNLNRQLR